MNSRLIIGAVILIGMAACKSEEQKMIGKWQPREVLDAGLIPIYIYEKRDSIFQAVFEEGRAYYTKEDSAFTETDSLNSIYQATEIIKRMFETTYDFQRNNQLIFHIYIGAGQKDTFIYDTVSYTLNKERKLLVFEKGEEKVGQGYEFLENGMLRLKDDAGGIYINLAKVD